MLLNEVLAVGELGPHAEAVERHDTTGRGVVKDDWRDAAEAAAVG